MEFFLHETQHHPIIFGLLFNFVFLALVLFLAHEYKLVTLIPGCLKDQCYN